MGRREQLARIESELADAHRRAHRIAASAENDAWVARPAAEQWSVGECLTHLNLTSRAFLPRIEGAIREGRDRAPSGGTPYRMDFVGWLLWLATTARVPIKTTEPFVPGRDEPRDMVLAEFEGRHDAQLPEIESLGPSQRLHLRQAERMVHTMPASSTTSPRVSGWSRRITLRTTRSGPER